MLLGGTTLAAASALGTVASVRQARAQPTPSGQQPNIIVIMGDDIGWSNIGVYNQGIMAALEKLETTESTTLALKREDGGKIRVSSNPLEDAKLLLPNEVLVVRRSIAVRKIARKAKKPKNGTRRSNLNDRSDATDKVIEA